MSDLVAIAYEDLPTAQQVASNLGEAVKGHDIELDDLVIVERKEDGKVKLHQPSLAGLGAASGALWGGLIGLIFFMPLFGMAIGAAAGAAGGALSDTGVDDKFMKRLGEELAPGKNQRIPGRGRADDDRPTDASLCFVSASSPAGTSAWVEPVRPARRTACACHR
jgi:uncharacterized membrane protein